MGGENIQSVPPPEPTPQTDVNPTPTPASDPAATNLQKTNTGTTPLPPAVTPPTLSPDEAISKARQEIGRKHFAEAKQAIKQSLIGNPKNTALYAELYEVCSKSNDWSDAAFALEKLAEADPSRERDYYVDYAKALFHLQRYEKAKAPALKAIASGKDKDEAHRLLYQIALRQKDEPTAIAEYREYLKLRPNDGEVHWEFANMLYKDGKGLKEALPEYKAAADNRPANSYGHERAAFLLLFDKQYDASISEYIKAIKTAPASESGRLNQALKYAQAQQKAAGAGNAPASKAK
jgi:tetratricopeptide (TPR) repeat protein